MPGQIQGDSPKVRVFSVAVSISISGKKQTFLYGGSAIRLYFNRVSVEVYCMKLIFFSHVIFLEDRELSRTSMLVSIIEQKFHSAIKHFFLTNETEISPFNNLGKHYHYVRKIKSCTH